MVHLDSSVQLTPHFPFDVLISPAHKLLTWISYWQHITYTAPPLPLHHMAMMFNSTWNLHIHMVETMDVKASDSYDEGHGFINKEKIHSCWVYSSIILQQGGVLENVTSFILRNCHCTHVIMYISCYKKNK